VEAAGLVFASALTESTGIANHGVGGWDWRTATYGQAGMVDAWNAIRNALAAL
jgi:hypothetical protein